MTAHRITVEFGRGNNYVAEIKGLHAKFTFDRAFIKMVSTGQKMNCYENHMSATAIDAGTIIEIQTANYKGKTKRVMAILQDDGSLRTLDMAEALAMIAG